MTDYRDEELEYHYRQSMLASLSASGELSELAQSQAETQQKYAYTGGYTCPSCHGWISYDTIHLCNPNRPPKPKKQTTVEVFDCEGNLLSRTVTVEEEVY